MTCVWFLPKMMINYRKYYDEKNIKTSFYIPVKYYKNLKALCRLQQKSMRQYILEAVCLKMENETNTETNIETFKKSFYWCLKNYKNLLKALSDA